MITKQYNIKTFIGPKLEKHFKFLDIGTFIPFLALF